MENLPLKSLRIAQFRAMQELKLEDFGRINLIVGPNNSGKTSVLDALSLFCRPLDINNWRETAWRREVKSARTPLTEPFKWLFPQFLGSSLSRPHSIWIYGQGEFAGRRLMAEYKEFKEFGKEELMLKEAPPDEDFQGEPQAALEIEVTADFAQGIMGHFDEANLNQHRVQFRVVDNRRNVYPTRVEQPALDLALISPHTHRTTQDTSWYFSEAIKRERVDQNLRQAFVEVMQRIDPDVLDLDLVETGQTTSTIMVKHRLTGRTPISAFGDGLRRALLIAATIPAVPEGVLLIDELESALHVSVLDSVLKTLKWAADRYNVQVFTTTHSLEAVDAVVRAFEGTPSSVVGYRLERSREGVAVKRSTGEMLRELRFEMGLEFR
jgi:energy-coupling factor transporter ATP-binding protein EcfA2